MRLLAEGCSSSTTGRRAARQAEEQRLPSEKDNNQLKFGIDRILGNSIVSATRTDNKNIGELMTYLCLRRKLLFAEILCILLGGNDVAISQLSMRELIMLP